MFFVKWFFSHFSVLFKKIQCKRRACIQMICAMQRQQGKCLNFFVLPRSHIDAVVCTFRSYRKKKNVLFLSHWSPKRRENPTECSMSLNFCTESTIIGRLPSFNLISNVCNSFWPDLRSTTSEHSFNVRWVLANRTTQKIRTNLFTCRECMQ